MKLNPFHPLPIELCEPILRFTDDLQLSIKVECILNGLPSINPDPTKVFDQFTPTIKTFPGSISLSKHWTISLYKTMTFQIGSKLSVAKYYKEDVTNAVLAWMYRWDPAGWKSEWTDRAIILGRLRIVQMLHRNMSPKFTEESPGLAVKHGHLDILILLLQQIEGYEKQIMYYATSRATRIAKFSKDLGHVDILRYFCEQDMDAFLSSGGMMHAAAGGGQLEAVKFFHEMGLSTSFEMETAASRGHLEVVKFFHENGVACTVDAMNLAAAGGYLDVVMFLDAHRIEGCTTSAMDWAIRRGNIEVVKYFHTHRGEEWTADRLKVARSRGNRDIMKYINSLHRELTKGRRRGEKGTRVGEVLCGDEVDGGSLTRVKS
ncbi:hypothetical protein BC829DRAFT_409678 [Chytridium lagenaria]|nr:hypothetical protein BC829DRAFT_409678 [Chytridium lagenaria]